MLHLLTAVVATEKDVVQLEKKERRGIYNTFELFNHQFIIIIIIIVEVWF